jgi:FkbM family methyltransferase
MVDIPFSYRGQSVCLTAPDERDEIPSLVQRSGTFYEFDVLERCESYLTRLGRVGGTIVDVGAYIGNHTLFFARFCGADRVIAFEPCHSSFEALTGTIERNRLRNVTAYNSAVGNRDGQATVVVADPTNRGANRVQPSGGEAPDCVPITRLDAVLESSGAIPKGISLMKIDVEGMECDVIQGSARSIARFKPILCVEILDAPHMRSVIQVLKGSSYVIRECNGAAPTYILTSESRIPRALIQAINYGWWLLARYGNNALRWKYRRVIEMALPV